MREATPPAPTERLTASEPLARADHTLSAFKTGPGSRNRRKLLGLSLHPLWPPRGIRAAEPIWDLGSDPVISTAASALGVHLPLGCAPASALVLHAAQGISPWFPLLLLLSSPPPPNRYTGAGAGRSCGCSGHDLQPSRDPELGEAHLGSQAGPVESKCPVNTQ